MRPRPWDDSWQRWQAEQAGTSPLPSALHVLAVFAALALVLVVLVGGTLTAAQRGGQSQDRRGPSLCQEHAGRPGWDAVCQDAAGRR